MFYITTLSDHIRVPPELFKLSTEESILIRIKRKYEGYIDKDVGIVIDVVKVNSIGKGVIIPGDGAAFYAAEFELLTYRPELQEVVLGKIKDIADFGAFMNIGPIEGMIHISQTMDDFVSFSKDKTLAGKETKRTLKIGDKCKARVIAVSFKDKENPKIGFTMRQPYLGRLDWALEPEKKVQVPTVEDKKAQKKAAK